MKIWEIIDTVELSDEKQQRVVILTKYEIETAIIGELAEFIPTVKYMPLDKGLPLLRKEAWRLADKYDTDAANVMNIMMKRYGELENDD